MDLIYIVDLVTFMYLFLVPVSLGVQPSWHELNHSAAGCPATNSIRHIHFI